MNSGSVSLRHRPFLTPIWLTAMAAFCVFAVAVFAVWEWGTANSTSIIVVRHAEKDMTQSVDPGLSAGGELRAALLARMFGATTGPGRIDAIYVSPTVRSRATAAPLAAALGLTPVAMPQEDGKSLARRVLHEHAGGRVLIVGHLDTVPAIVAALSGNGHIAKVPESQYGTMYIVTVPRIGHANFVELRY
jgi:2,3-bisphosphoglycerate-dependent phosphoglycerate mutase